MVLHKVIKFTKGKKFSTRKTKKANARKTKWVNKRKTIYNGGGFFDTLFKKNVATELQSNMFKIFLLDLCKFTYYCINVQNYIIINYAIKNIPWDTLKNDLTLKFTFTFDKVDKQYILEIDKTVSTLYINILTPTINPILKQMAVDHYIESNQHIFKHLCKTINKYIKSATNNQNSEKIIKFKQSKKYAKYNKEFSNVSYFNITKPKSIPNTNVNVNANTNEYDKYISFGDLYYYLNSINAIEPNAVLLHKLTTVDNLLVLIKYKIVNTTTQNAIVQATGHATEEATGHATEEATGHATEEATGHATEEATGHATKESTEEATGHATEEATGQTENKDLNYLMIDNGKANGQANEQANGQANEQANEQANGQAKSEYLEILPEIETISVENIVIEPKSLEDTKIRVAALLLLKLNNDKKTNYEKNYEKTLKYLNYIEPIIKYSIRHMDSAVSTINKKNKKHYNSILEQMNKRKDNIETFDDEQFKKFRDNIARYFIYDCMYSIGNYRACINIANILDNIHNVFDKIYSTTIHKYNSKSKNIHDLLIKYKFDNYLEIKKLLEMLPKVEGDKNSYFNTDLEQQYIDYLREETRKQIEAEARSEMYRLM